MKYNKNNIGTFQWNKLADRFNKTALRSMLTTMHERRRSAVKYGRKAQLELIKFDIEEVRFAIHVL